MQQLLDEQMRTKLSHQEANSKIQKTIPGTIDLSSSQSHFERKRNRSCDRYWATTRSYKGAGEHYCPKGGN